jgi:hypothetical protein
MAVATNEKTTLAGPSRPLGSPDIPQFFLPTSSKKGTYAPRLYGAASIQFGDRRRKIDEVRKVAVVLPLDPMAKTVDWESAKPCSVAPDKLLKDAQVAAEYLPLPRGAMELTSFTRWAKAFDRWLARTQRLEATTKSEPAETVSLGPKRGGVSVELVAIVWELV